MMTHEGPGGSSTAQNVKFPTNEKYVCGAPYLREKMIDNYSRIVCDVHGHSHDGATIQNIYKP